jgi:hypothetical protein
MSKKLSVVEQRQKLTVSILPEAKEMLFKVSSEMNMSSSRFIEFLLMSMKKQDEMSASEYMIDLFKSVMNIKKK